MILQLTSGLLLTWLIFWHQPKDEYRKFYWAGLVLKVCCGWLLGYFYLIHFENGDTLAFHRQATELYQLSLNSFSEYLNTLFTANYPIFKAEARNELFVKILSIIYIPSGGSYWFAAAILSLISFWTTWKLVMTMSHYKPELTKAAILSFLFIPSVTFWSSGILKDSLVFSCICYLIIVILDHVYSKKVTFIRIHFTFIILLLLFYLKFYLFALAIFSMGSLIVYDLINRFFRAKAIKITLIALSLLSLCLLVSKTNFNLNFEHLPQSLYENHNAFIGESDFHFERLKPTYWSLISYSPLALATGLLRPFPWEANLWKILFSLEGIAIIILITFNVYHYRKWSFNKLIVIGIVFSVVLFTFLALSTPNFGTLIRYRITAMPIVTFILLITPSKHFLSKPSAFP